MSTLPGWICVCGAANAPRRARCRQCGAPPRPALPREPVTDVWHPLLYGAAGLILVVCFLFAWPVLAFLVIAGLLIWIGMNLARIAGRS